MIVPIHLFVKKIKNLMCHTDIGGCKVGVLHPILIEFIVNSFKRKRKLHHSKNNP